MKVLLALINFSIVLDKCSASPSAVFIYLCFLCCLFSFLFSIHLGILLEMCLFISVLDLKGLLTGVSEKLKPLCDERDLTAFPLVNLSRNKFVDILGDRSNETRMVRGICVIGRFCLRCYQLL
jgi:hypothetical protein